MVIEQKKDFCFCTLALGGKYRQMVKDLSADLEQYSPGTLIVVYTDMPKDFSGHRNVLAFKHIQKGIKHCYHDKRFVIQKALSLFRVAIFIDADTRIVASVPDSIEWLPGITSGVFKNICEQGANRKHPVMLKYAENIAQKLGVSLSNVSWTEENLLIIARDEGREIEFIKQWGIIAKYFELRHIHSGEGNAIGLAAAKVGWNFMSNQWDELDKVRKHIYVVSKPWLHKDKPKTSPSLPWDELKQKLAYNYRLNIARITAALSDFDFYYR